MLRIVLLKHGKTSICTIVDKRIKFYSQNTNLLPPKHKSSVRHLKQSIQEFHRKCNEQPSKATANPVGGKACSPTKGDLLRYIPNTYSIHKVSSLKIAYFQGKLSRYITSPSEKTRPESWPGDYMGKATPVWRLSSSNRCHQM